MNEKQLEQMLVQMKKVLSVVLEDGNIEPCIRYGAENLLAHTEILCIELGLDLIE